MSTMSTGFLIAFVVVTLAPVFVPLFVPESVLRRRDPGRDMLWVLRAMALCVIGLVVGIFA